LKISPKIEDEEKFLIKCRCVCKRTCSKRVRVIISSERKNIPMAIRELPREELDKL
jgi:hypothetical protein